MNSQPRVRRRISVDVYHRREARARIRADNTRDNATRRRTIQTSRRVSFAHDFHSTRSFGDYTISRPLIVFMNL